MYVSFIFKNLSFFERISQFSSGFCIKKKISIGHCYCKLMTSQKTMDDTSKVNKWILGYLPKDLIDILKREYTDPTTKGRKEAINDDNVNDFVYYGIRKKLFWKYNGFYQVIKTDSGNKIEPAKYALEKKSI